MERDGSLKFMVSILRGLPYLSPYLVVWVMLQGIMARGIWVLAGALFVLALHPFLDALVGQAKVTKEAPLGEKSPVLGMSSFWASALLWAYFPVQTFAIFFVLQQGLNPSELEFWGAAFSLGVTTGGMGITIAHELIHRRVKWERAIGVGLLFQVSYTHFRIEHVLGHHRWVATPRDPATAREGESLFQFLPRTLWGSLQSAFRLRPRFVLAGGVSQVLGLLLIGSVWGESGILLFLLQSIVAILMLETVNYIEHYGLQRKELASGVYEPVTETHSWNSLHRMTNWFLFNLGMHAEHHSSPLVTYEKLKPIPRPRTLPYGYSTLLVLAWMPPLWRRIFAGRSTGI